MITIRLSCKEEVVLGIGGLEGGGRRVRPEGRASLSSRSGIPRNSSTSSCSRLERTGRIGEFWSYPQSRNFAELLIDCEQNRTLRQCSLGCCASRPACLNGGTSNTDRTADSRLANFLRAGLQEDGHLIR